MVQLLLAGEHDTSLELHHHEENQSDEHENQYANADGVRREHVGISFG